MAQITPKRQSPSLKTAQSKAATKYVYALGRRKTAIARVKLFAGGHGKIIVNQREYKEYFPNFVWSENLEMPFETVGEKDKYDVEVKVIGGGPKGQSEAIRLAIARALVKINADYKALLRAAGFMTRDPRAKERKKPGLKRARRAPQWSKR